MFLAPEHIGQQVSKGDAVKHRIHVPFSFRKDA
jgi:hypothetical protein